MFMHSAGGSVWGALFTLELVVACVTDVRLRRIPNVLVLAILVTGFGFSIATRGVVAGLTSSAAGAILGFGIWILFYGIGAMGAGDVKFFAAVGSWLGPSLTWRAALVAGVIGGLLAVGFLLRERRLASATRRIGLAVISRTSLVIDPPDAAPRNMARLPYGLALASGAFIAAWWPRLLA